MSFEELKEFFTIKINENKYIPQIYEDDKYIHLEYLDNNFMLGFAVTKGSHMGIIKRTITDEIYNELKTKGVLY